MEEDERFKAFNHAGEWDTTKDDPLFDLAAELARFNLIGQMADEFTKMVIGNTTSIKFLLRCIDQIHFALCPGHTGTWQQRAEEAVREAQAIPGRLENIKQAAANLLEAIDAKGLTVRR